VQGIWKDHISDNKFYANRVTYDPSDLVDFDAKESTVHPSLYGNILLVSEPLIFLSTERLSKEYENNVFVGDVNNRRIYHFKLNQNRTGLFLEDPSIDKIADSDKELGNVVFAENFGIIMDFKMGLDGYLYFVVNDEGKIYRIVPSNFS
jgi:hypothetical protein